MGGILDRSGPKPAQDLSKSNQSIMAGLGGGWFGGSTSSTNVSICGSWLVVLHREKQKMGVSSMFRIVEVPSKKVLGTGSIAEDLTALVANKMEKAESSMLVGGAAK